MHAWWTVFLEQFHYFFQHKPGFQNFATDALSRQLLLLTTLKIELVAFDSLKDLYVEDLDFAETWTKCLRHEPMGDYSIHGGFLFKSSKLCIPRSFLRTYLIRKFHKRGLVAYMGQDKTLALLEACF